MTDRRDLLRLTGFLVALLVVAGAIMLATQGGSSGSDDRSSGTQQVDGVVLEVTSTKLVLRPEGAASPMTFEIRATELPAFDVFHLQEHAADGLSTRVTYLEDGSKRYALRADDAPLT